MRMKIDGENCTGHGRCAKYAPNVFRLDDDGNKVPMWYFRERGVAEAVARRYEQLGHKQLYVVDDAP